MPRQSKYNKEEKDNVKSYQYKAAIYIRLSVEDGDKEESNSITNQRMLLNQFLKIIQILKYMIIIQMMDFLELLLIDQDLKNCQKTYMKRNLILLL